MILNSETRQADSASFGIEESINMSIDTSDQVALMSILSENLYKDAIGSLIRESASNALDATREAGNNEPIIVGLKSNKNYNYTYSVQDFGTGISPQRVKDVLSKYAASTKRGSNDYLGYYGLGFKAPLAYTDSFVFTTRFEGIEYTYTMYKSEKGTKIDLVNEAPTEERNGTTIQVALKSRLDHATFTDKIREQLAYFEGVYFDVPGIPNDFHIIKNEDWKYSELLASGKGMHICLENVYYEIDWERLKIPKIEMSIGLNFKIEDGLLPIPSREDIKYTDEAKELIRIKIAAVADYFLRKFNETRVEVEDFELIYDKFNVSSVTIEGKSFIINPLEKYSYIKPAKPSLKGVRLIDLERVANAAMGNKLFQNYEIRGKIRQHSFTGKYEDWNVKIFGRDKNTNIYQIVLAEHAPKGLQLEYLKDLYPYAEFLYKKRELKLGKPISHQWLGNNSIADYHHLLNLKDYPKAQWREMIKELQYILNQAVDKFPKLAKLQPTTKWLEDRKANRAKGRRTTVEKEEVSFKLARNAHRGDKDVAYDPYLLSIGEVGKRFKSLMVYGTTEDKERMESMYPLIKNHDYRKLRTNLILINRYEVKKIKNLHNFISIDEFMKGQNRPFKAFATALLIADLEKKHKEVFENTDFVDALSKPLAEKIIFLKEYQKNNFPDVYGHSDGFLTEVLKVAQEHNLFDESAMLIYNEVSEKAPIFDFIKVIRYSKRDEVTLDALQLAREILKGRKFRMDWENYLELNPVVQVQEPDEDDDDEEEDESPFEEGGVAQVAGFTDEEIEFARQELTDDGFVSKVPIEEEMAF